MHTYGHRELLGIHWCFTKERKAVRIVLFGKRFILFQWQAEGYEPYV